MDQLSGDAQRGILIFEALVIFGAQADQRFLTTLSRVVFAVAEGGILSVAELVE